MTIRTITITDITAVDFDEDLKNPYFYLSEKFVWVKNKSPSAMYVSDKEIPDAGTDGVSEIPSGECVLVNTPAANIIYLSGDGDAEIYTSDVAVFTSITHVTLRPVVVTVCEIKFLNVLISVKGCA